MIRIDRQDGTSVSASRATATTHINAPATADIILEPGSDLKPSEPVNLKIQDHSMPGYINAVSSSHSAERAYFECNVGHLVHSVNCLVHHLDLPGVVKELLPSYKVDVRSATSEASRYFEQKGSALDFFHKALNAFGCGYSHRPDGTLLIEERPSARDEDLELQVYPERRNGAAAVAYATHLERRRSAPAPAIVVVDDALDTTMGRELRGQRASVAEVAPGAETVVIHGPGYWRSFPSTGSSWAPRSRVRPYLGRASGEPWVPEVTWSLSVYGAPVFAGEIINLVDDVFAGKSPRAIVVSSMVEASANGGVWTRLTAVPVEGDDAAELPPAPVSDPVSPALELGLVVDEHAEGGFLKIVFLWDESRTPVPARVVAPLASSTAGLAAPAQLGDPVVVGRHGSELWILGALNTATTPHPAAWDPSTSIWRMPMMGGNFCDITLGPNGIKLAASSNAVALLVEAGGVFVVDRGARTKVGS